MKLLTILICSHERPSFLVNQLDSLISLLNENMCQIYISDNSLMYQQQINDIAEEYKVNLVSSPGKTSTHNFTSFLNIPRTKYIMILHDDDITIVYNKKALFNRLESEDVPLFFAKSYAVEENVSYRIQKYNETFILNESGSIANYIFPYKLPAFPSLIYRWDIVFEQIFVNNISNKVAGKYSDSVIILDICDYYRCTPVILNELILYCRWHCHQDVQKYDFNSHLKLLKYALPRVSFKHKMISTYFFILNLVRTSIKLLL